MTDQLNHPTHRHPNDRDLYTPCTDELYALLDQMYRELGTWRMVAWKSGLRLKILRNIRRGKYKSVALTTLDRLISGTGVGDLNDWVWFKPHDLVRLGVWEPNLYVEGKERVQGEARWETVKGERIRSKKPELEQERGKISKQQIR